MRPTHKADIIALYETGKDETEIARQTHHAQKSVGKFIRDYERGKMLPDSGTSVDDARTILQMQPGVIQAYIVLVEQHHPDLIRQVSPA